MTNIPDWLAAIGILSPSATGLGGYWLAGRNEEKRDRRIAQREAAARQEARNEGLEDERHEFQLQLLLELQDAIQQHMRITLQAIEHDLDNIEHQGHRGLLGPELNSQSLNSNANLTRLISRILDDDLRTTVNDFYGRSVEVIHLTKDESSLPADMQVEHLKKFKIKLAPELRSVLDNLGNAIRNELGRPLNIPPQPSSHDSAKG